jgi:uncharacterized protein (TIGR03435 family)
MEHFAAYLSFQVGAPVRDATGLKGKYDFDLSWVPQMQFRATPPPQLQHGGTIPSLPDIESGPTVFEALRSQLGLGLERKKGQVEVLVVDQVERRPTEN